MPEHDHQHVPDKAELAVSVGLKIESDFHVHHHQHNHVFHDPGQPGVPDILNSIQAMRTTFMTQLQDALAELKADDAQLEAEIDEVLGKLAQVPGEIAAAVQEALTNAGVDDTTARQAVIDIDNGVKAALAKVTAVLNPPTDGGGDTDSGGDTSTDTLVGGQGDDTVTGGNGDDTVDAGGGTDTTAGGQGSDIVDTGAGGGAITDDNQSAVEAADGQPASGGATPPASDAV